MNSQNIPKRFLENLFPVFYDTDDLEKTGLYIKTEYGYEEISESDSDYEPGETDSSESENLSDGEANETQDEGF